MIPLSSNDLGYIQRAARDSRSEGPAPTLSDAAEAARALDAAALSLSLAASWLRSNQGRLSESALEKLEDLINAPELLGVADAATVLMRTRELPAELKAEVGWPWQLCGWRHCGAIADAEKALSVLRAQAGMLTGAEAAFLVDVARRSVDAARGACFLFGPPLWPANTPFEAGPYLPTAALDEVLHDDAAIEEYEAELLRGYQANRESVLDEADDAQGDDGTTDRPIAMTEAQRKFGLVVRMGLGSD